jgi:A/G-specific adenine glycosylase
VTTAATPVHTHPLPVDFSRRLIDWQAKDGRHDMPWQINRTPYRVWLSEIMLQQTQVQTARDYYLRFLRVFPSVQALANAKIDDVLAQWSGLGYYSRARNLHACAKVITSDHAGEFPRTPKQLAELPGIGPSTAAAIASFCFDEPITIFDGNVQRVISRLTGFGQDLAGAPAKRALNTIAQSALDGALGPMAGHTQGLMDLGATVCTPKKPKCSSCPFQADCVAHGAGLELQYPVVTKKLVRKELRSHWVCLWDGDALRMARRPDAGIWSGLWTPIEIASQDFDCLRDWASRWGLPDAPGLVHFSMPRALRCTQRGGHPSKSNR